MVQRSRIHKMEVNDREEDDIVHLNLRGTRFSTTQSTLDCLPICLGKDGKGTYDVKNNEYFFNRNPVIFHQVLDYCVFGQLHLPENVCSQSIREELEFWGVPQNHVQQCCWRALYKKDDEMDTLNKLLTYLPLETDSISKISIEGNVSLFVTCKMKLWAFLQDSRSSRAAKIWKIFMVVTVMLSLLTFLMESEDSFRNKFPITSTSNFTNMTNQDIMTGSRPKTYVGLINGITNLFLTIEIVLTLFSCPDKKQFFKSFLNMSEIVSCIAVWLYLYLEYFTITFTEEGERNIFFIIVYLFGLFRVFRVFRFVVNNSGMRILMLSLRSSFRELGLLFLSFLSFAVMFATLIYVCEFASVNRFQNIFISIWWAFITMTTVGYGDFVPSTSLGYLVGGVCAIFGILLIAMPVAVTSSNFNEFFNYNRYRHRHNQNAVKYQNSIKKDGKSSLEPGNKKTLQCSTDYTIKAVNTSRPVNRITVVPFSEN